MAIFEQPVVAFQSTGSPEAGVVGALPYEDDDDATYVWATLTGSEYVHINAPVVAGALTGTPLTATVRASATYVPPTTIGRADVVMNFYLPGASASTDSPPLNLAAGDSPVYVNIPTDGQIHDITATFMDWMTEVPATAAQIGDYFSQGGFLLFQPRLAQGGMDGQVDIRVYEIQIGNVIPVIAGRVGDVRRRFVRPSHV